MLDALKRHWTRYLMEALGLGVFMTGASLLATLLDYPGSPVSRAVQEPATRLALLGVGMGIVIAGIVYSPWGKKSGAHINPAVTWAFFRLGKITFADAVWYTLAQFAGALIAVQMMGLLIGRPYQHPSINHVVTVPGTNGVWGAFWAEFLISFLLMWVILMTVNRKPLEKWGGALTGILIMFYLAVETPWSGMSLNPARTFGSAFAAREWTGLWVYFTSPILAMLLAAEAYRRLQSAHLDGQTYPMEDKQENTLEDKQENTLEDKPEERQAATPATGSGRSRKGIFFMNMRRLKPRAARFGALVALALLAAPSVRAQGQDVREVAPAAPSVGTQIPSTYFGPMPSEIKKELVGPYLLLKAGKVDKEHGTVTLPLYQGRLKDGRKVWYVLTDTTDKNNADALGLLFSAKLNFAATGKAVRTANLEKPKPGEDGATLVFDSGTVDFKPEHKLTPGNGPNAFPPAEAQPGSVGDKDYSPLVRIQNAGGHIYNAPMIAFDVDASQISFPNGSPDYRLVHDKVVKIDPAKMTVTLKLTVGFSFAKPVFYLSFDSNDRVAATLEESTLAPALGDIEVGHDDGAFSAVERLFSFANGPMGKDNPQRQGLSSALVDGNGPVNIFGGIPTVAADYSPIWDFQLGEWTPEAIQKGYRSRLIEEFQILGFVEKGWITGPMGKKYGSTGIVIDCPVVMRLL